MKLHVSYLVGPRDSYLRHCHAHGIPADSLAVVHVSTLEELKSVHDGQVVFLQGWQLLKEGRAMYGYFVGRRAAGRLAHEYADLAPEGPQDEPVAPRGT